MPATHRSRRLLAALAMAVASAGLAPGVRGFSVAGSQDAALSARCIRGYDVVNRACGMAPAGQSVPSQCTAWCQLVYVSWWPKCQDVREYATIETTSNHALSGFYSTCQAAARPTCSPCPGSAKASDVLRLDERVLSPSSPQAAAFRVTWRGQMANLLCVSPSQVAVTAIARAAAAGGGSSDHRLLSEVGARVSVQVTWSLAAGSSAQAQSLVQAGQHVMGLPAMGRRQLKRKKKSSCVVGQNVGPLIRMAKAVQEGKPVHCPGCPSWSSAAHGLAAGGKSAKKGKAFTLYELPAATGFTSFSMASALEYNRLCRAAGLLPVSCGGKDWGQPPQTQDCDASRYFGTAECVPMPAAWGCNMEDGLSTATGWKSFITFISQPTSISNCAEATNPVQCHLGRGLFGVDAAGSRGDAQAADALHPVCARMGSP